MRLSDPRAAVERACRAARSGHERVSKWPAAMHSLSRVPPQLAQCRPGRGSSVVAIPERTIELPVRYPNPADSEKHGPSKAPRVLVVLDSSDAWARGALRGFANFAHQRDWVLFHYRRFDREELLRSGLTLDGAVLGPSFAGPWPEEFGACTAVSVNVDRRSEGMVSVELDWAKAAELAASHLLSRGYRHLTTYRSEAWGTLREQHFRRFASAAGANLEPSWQSEATSAVSSGERPATVMRWLSHLPKPCGVFALCDIWARSLARYARAAHLSIPEDIAIVGVDDDVFECDVESPALSSVAVPWRDFGEAAARLLQLSFNGEALPGRQVLVPPLDVVVRRSSDGLAIDDPLVAAAVLWIRDHASSPMTVPMIAAAVGSTRQRLERRFRRQLGRTIIEELRRTRVEAARELLWTTTLPLATIAERCGFANASLLSTAFRREVGIPPGAYRKRARGAAP